MKQIIHYMRRVTNADIITNTYPHLTKTSLVFSRTKQKPDPPTRKREIANMWHDPKKKNIPHVQSCPKQGLWDPHVACTRLPSKSCKDSLSYASTRAITSISFVVYIIIYSPHARACMSPKGKKNQGMRSWDLIGRCGVRFTVLLPKTIVGTGKWQLGWDFEPND
jgi:hypothetical protein